MVGAGRERPAPERVGRYEVLLPIASGGMAAVYLARTQGAGGFEQQVALKVTHPHLIGTTEFVADLVEEAKLAARIRHKNVISVLDVGEDDVGVFLVMEYVEGDTLANIRRKMDNSGETIPIGVTGRILIDALAGLHAAHELTDDHGVSLGIVHRDVTPQNLLVGIDGVVRLADFGIAKATSRLGQTQSGLVKGKVAYMSPEQAKGTTLDRRCDVWALGIIAWEMFAGRRMYEALEDIAIILRLVNHAPPRLREVVPDIHPAIDEAIARALTLDPDQRTPTALAFSREIAAACRAAGGIAEADEVAEVVARVVGPKLAERRRTVASIVGSRATPRLPGGGTDPQRVVVGPVSSPMLTPSGPIMPAAAPTPAASFVPSSPNRPESTTTSVSTSMGIAPRKPLPWSAVAAIPAGVLGGILLLSGIVFGVRSLRAPHATADAPVLEPSGASAVAPPDAPPAPPVPAPSVTDPAPAASPAVTGPITVRITANAPLDSARLNGSPLALERQGRDVFVHIPPEEVDGTFDLVASDGRKASASLASGSTALEVDFPAAPVAAASPPPSPAPAPSPRPPTTVRPPVKPSGPQLAPDPYKK